MIPQLLVLQSLIFLGSVFSTPRHHVEDAIDIRSCMNGPTCIKLRILKLASHFGKVASFPIGPGASLVKTEHTAGMMKRLLPLANSPLTIRKFLGELIIDYLGSLNLTFQLKESNLLEHVESFGLQLRKSKISIGRNGYDAGWYTIGTITAVGFVLLGILCGNAVMVSLMALALSAVMIIRSTTKGSTVPTLMGSPAKMLQHEIIEKPSYNNYPSTTDYYEYQVQPSTAPYSLKEN